MMFFPISASSAHHCQGFHIEPTVTCPFFRDPNMLSWNMILRFDGLGFGYL